jgi:hypothetical protein
MSVPDSTLTDGRLEELLEAVRAHSGMSDEEIIAAANHGADAGWPQFTYTLDAAEFTREHRDLVWSLLADEADSMGSPNVVAHVGQFQCADMVWEPDDLDCLLSWWALETAGGYLAAEQEGRHPLLRGDAPTDPRERWRIRNGR